MNGGGLRLRDPTALLILIVAFCSILSVWRPLWSAPAIDFYQFWVVGREVAGGHPGDVYSDEARAQIGERHLAEARADDDPARLRTALHRSDLDTFSTPFLYGVFGAFSSGDYERDLATYRALSLLVLVLSIATLCRLLGYGPPATLVAITLFTCFFAPSRSDVVVGNVNHFQLGLLVLFLWLACRFPGTSCDVAGGFLLGLGAMFKPNTALVIALLWAGWAMRRELRRITFASAGLAAGALLAFVWGSVAFGGIGIWGRWLSALSNLPDDLIPVELGNYAPTRLLAEAFSVELTGWIALLCGGLALAAMARGLLGPRRAAAADPARLEDIQVVALAGLITLLSAPLSWLHYFVAAIPMLLVVLRPAAGAELERPLAIVIRTAAVAALLTIMIQPMVMLGLGAPHDRLILLCAGTIVLFGLGLRELASRRSVSTDRLAEA